MSKFAKKLNQKINPITNLLDPVAITGVSKSNFFRPTAKILAGDEPLTARTALAKPLGVDNLDLKKEKDAAAAEAANIKSQPVMPVPDEQGLARARRRGRGTRGRGTTILGTDYETLG